MKSEIKTKEELMKPCIEAIDEKYISLEGLKDYLGKRIRIIEETGYKNPTDTSYYDVSYYNTIVSVYEDFFGKWGK